MPEMRREDEASVTRREEEMTKEQKQGRKETVS